MKKILLVILSACILVACNKNKKVVVDATYADGLPKKVSEYIIKEDGSQQLAKETYYFPEKKKYIEGEYNSNTQRKECGLLGIKTDKKTAKALTKMVSWKEFIRFGIQTDKYIIPVSICTESKSANGCFMIPWELLQRK